MKKEIKCVISVYGTGYFSSLNGSSTSFSELDKTNSEIIVNSEFDAREGRKFYVIYPPFKEVGYTPECGKEESCRKIECSNAIPLYKWIAENDKIPGGITPYTIIKAIKEDYFSNWEVNRGKIIKNTKEIIFEKDDCNADGNVTNTTVFNYLNDSQGVIEFCKDLNKIGIKENYFFNSDSDFGPTAKKYNQLEYNKKWAENNKAHSSYLKSRSSARSFIRNKATLEDIEELSDLLEDRKKVLENS